MVTAPLAWSDPAAPGAVGTPLVQSVTATSITVHWTAPADPVDVTGYRVDYSTDQGSTWQNGAEVAGPATTVATIPGLIAGTAYDVRVEAYGDGGQGPSRLANAVQSFGLGDIDSCVVLADHAVRCWGFAANQDNPTPYDMPGLSSTVQVAANSWGGVCGLRTNGDVLCGYLQTKGPATVFTKIAGLPHDIVQIAYRQSVGCALTSGGAVYCWGYNGHGGLGIGSSKPVSSTTALQVTGLGAAASIAVGYETGCAVMRLGGQLMCWGDDDSGLLGDGGGHNRFAPVAVHGLTDVVGISMGQAAACAVVQHPNTDSAVSCWGIPYWSNPMPDPVTPYVVAHGYTSAVVKNLLSDGVCLAGGADGASCGLLDGTDVAAVDGDGFGQWCAQHADGTVQCDGYPGVHVLDASAITTTDATAPLAPNDVQIATHGGSATVSWLAPLDGGSPITSYVVERSIDGGDSWTALPGSSLALQREVDVPDSGRADLYRVRARNAVGLSDGSDPVVVTPGGTGPQRITIETPEGEPVIGGAVTWASADGDSESAVPSTLTADGVVTFARVVAGPATVTIANGMLPNGTAVSGSWPVTLGTDAQDLQVPELPDIVTRSVQVVLPNGVPVVNASVRGTDGFRVSPCLASAAFTFCGGVARTVLTGDDGVATISSWANPKASPAADVVYSDGVLAQRQSVALPTSRTTVQLQYTPWLTVNADGSPVDVGQLSSIAFAVNEPPDDGGPVAARIAAKQRVKITITPPAGWSSKRCAKASTLSGTTDARGKLTLHICASRSGVYRVTSHGAVTTRSVLIRVRGAVAMAPTSLTTRSHHAGAVSLSWAKPVYAGGATITGYRITATSAHQRTRTVVVTHKSGPWTARQMSRTLTGLTAGHKWTVKVAAVTRHGVGAGVTSVVSVA